MVKILNLLKLHRLQDVIFKFLILTFAPLLARMAFMNLLFALTPNSAVTGITFTGGSPIDTLLTLSSRTAWLICTGIFLSSLWMFIHDNIFYPEKTTIQFYSPLRFVGQILLFLFLAFLAEFAAFILLIFIGASIG